MKKKLISVLIIISLLFLSIEVLTNSSSIMKTVIFSFSVWTNNIFPSLFPFFVLSEILINYGFIELASELFKPLMQTLFKAKGESAFVFIMSMVSGFPSNAKYVRELYLKDIINEKEAEKILMFTHFSNPLFILGTVATIFLNNKNLGPLILISHYLGNIIIGILFRQYHGSKTKEKGSIKKAINNMHNKRINNNLTFGNIITNSLLNAINTLLLILGTVTMFLCLTTLIDNNINLSNYHQSILNGFLEMTQGLKYISLLDIPLKLKAVISTMIISFGGFSVHMQLISILSDTKIKYLPFLTARVIHAFISSLLVFLFFDIYLGTI